MGEVGIKHFVRNTNTKYFTLVSGIFTIIKQGSVIVIANHSSFYLHIFPYCHTIFI